MPEFTDYITCPECGYIATMEELKIYDMAVDYPVGAILTFGVCPKCNHKFVLL